LTLCYAAGNTHTITAGKLTLFFTESGKVIHYLVLKLFRKKELLITNI